MREMTLIVIGAAALTAASCADAPPPPPPLPPLPGVSATAAPAYSTTPGGVPVVTSVPPGTAPGPVSAHYAAAAGRPAVTYPNSQLASALDPSDAELLRYCERETMKAPTGKAWAWRNPKTGNSGTMTATTPLTRVAGGPQCRSFSETITLKDGRSETIRGRRCQHADGSWEIVG